VVHNVNENFSEFEKQGVRWEADQNGTNLGCTNWNWKIENNIKRRSANV